MASAANTVSDRIRWYHCFGKLQCLSIAAELASGEDLWDGRTSTKVPLWLGLQLTFSCRSDESTILEALTSKELMHNELHADYEPLRLNEKRAAMNWTAYETTLSDIDLDDLPVRRWMTAQAAERVIVMLSGSHFRPTVQCYRLNRAHFVMPYVRSPTSITSPKLLSMVRFSPIEKSQEIVDAWEACRA
jgi:hypothetical protein